MRQEFAPILAERCQYFDGEPRWLSKLTRKLQDQEWLRTGWFPGLAHALAEKHRIKVWQAASAVAHFLYPADCKLGEPFLSLLKSARAKRAAARA